MKKDKHKTKALFLIEQETDLKIPVSIFAYFPHEKFDAKGNNTCYSHIGQHSGCSVQYSNECKTAEYNQFYELAKELSGLGYNLTILNKIPAIEYHRKPTISEIKFGYGATHYKSFKQKHHE